VRTTNKDLTRYPELIKRYPIFLKPFLKSYGSSTAASAKPPVIPAANIKPGSLFAESSVPMDHASVSQGFAPDAALLFDVTAFDNPTFDPNKFGCTLFEGTTSRNATNDATTFEVPWLQMPFNWPSPPSQMV
jgi:hypothetical protein